MSKCCERRHVGKSPLGLENEGSRGPEGRAGPGLTRGRARASPAWRRPGSEAAEQRHRRTGRGEWHGPGCLKVTTVVSCLLHPHPL